MTTPLETKLEPRSDRPADAARPGIRFRRAGEDAVLWLHHQAERMDWVPPEFGREAKVDDSDAGSLVREWVRQARLWAAYNPEEMLALKAGAVALAAALLVFVVIVSALG